MTGRKTKISFEKALKDLESIVDDMENGKLTLQASLKAYEKGVGLTRQCQQALKEAEQSIQQLSNNELESFTANPPDNLE
ncbi:MAG: exodeoxyribonuclease VII small subunit [gamma proteobacterium symbiont of Bathyaustriella thionipta]|nr:exodeoxyribonuclease VII small subunit [gamma proteobacterium symbiont of Bathyaustriella thionipta]